MADVSLRGLWLRVLGVFVGCALLSCVVVSQAFGAEAPRWAIRVNANPTNLPLSGEGTGQVIVQATNIGGASTNGTAIAITDMLPASLSATAVKGFDAYRAGEAVNGGALISGALTCTSSPVECRTSSKVDPGDVLVMTITVTSSATATVSETNRAIVNGGGPAEASFEGPIVSSGESALFGPSAGSELVALSGPQAGAHPNMTTAFSMNMGAKNFPAGSSAKDIGFDLPRGMVGTVAKMPRCPIENVLESTEHTNPSSCPTDTMVGMVVATILGAYSSSSLPETVVTPLYNVAPNPGEPVAFAFEAVAVPVRLDTTVLSDGEDEVRVGASDITQGGGLMSLSVTTWGVPADHTGSGEDKTQVQTLAFKGETFGGNEVREAHRVVLSAPTQCSIPLTARYYADPWDDPGVFDEVGVTVNDGSASGGLTGCEDLSFRPGFSMVPSSLSAGVPAGYTFDLSLPQEEAITGLATPDLKDVSVKLPLGTVISPSAASGLQSCSKAQFYGPSEGSVMSEPAVFGHCPAQSKIGRVTIVSPDIEEPLTGSVYLGAPECDPCSAQDAEDGRMVHLFIEASSLNEEQQRQRAVYSEAEQRKRAERGEEAVVIKLAGEGAVDQSNGQITATFNEQPQLPVGNLKVELFSGPQAVLANPRACGQYTTGLGVTPWSEGPEVQDAYSFAINENCIGSAFAPAFTAGTQNNQAGGYGTFTLGLGREDGEEYLGGVQTTLPPGLLAMISSVPQCAEAQANEGTCPSSSLIGHVSTLVGPGSDPYAIEGGQVYLTGPYEGAPFGLSIVVPASAGPYTLSGTTGKGTVVVRARIAVNPTTAQATITSNPFPSELDGIPLQIRRVDVSVDREGFMFNATNCSALSVTGTVSSTQGASEGVASRYEAANCAALPFKPVFTASTQGSTSKASGASLRVDIASSGLGQSGIAKVDLTIPKLLPARLTTLQQACTEAQFDANPAGCPAGSDIATVVLHTPILASLLTGPAYFVSHGGAAFPDVEMVLQGEGVTLILDGHTDIKGGVTYSKFETVPDAPFTSFEFNAPEGPHSIFTTEDPGKTNLCATSTTKTVTVKKKVRVKTKHGGHKTVTRKVKKTEKVAQSLTIPTTIVGQNGATITQNTPVAVTGCAKKATSVKTGAKPKKAKQKQKQKQQKKK